MLRYDHTRRRGCPAPITEFGVIGERGLDNGALEYRYRRDTENSEIPLDGALDGILEKLGNK